MYSSALCKNQTFQLKCRQHISSSFLAGIGHHPSNHDITGMMDESMRI